MKGHIKSNTLILPMLPHCVDYRCILLMGSSGHTKDLTLRTFCCVSPLLFPLGVRPDMQIISLLKVLVPAVIRVCQIHVSDTFTLFPLRSDGRFSTRRLRFPRSLIDTNQTMAFKGITQLEKTPHLHHLPSEK